MYLCCRYVGMRMLIVFYFLGCSFHTSAQATMLSVVRMEGDTISVSWIKFNKVYTKVLCETNGTKKTFSAKEIQIILADSIVYESATIKQGLRHAIIFMKCIESGNLNLYTRIIRVKKILWSNIAEDFIRLHWVYRAQKWVDKTWQIRYYYRMAGEKREMFSKYLPKQTKLCVEFKTYLLRLDDIQRADVLNIVKQYNKLCGR